METTTTTNKNMYLIENADVIYMIPAVEIYRNIRVCVEPFTELPPFTEIPVTYIVQVAKELEGLADCIHVLNQDRSAFFNMEVAVLIMKCGANISKILGA